MGPLLLASAGVLAFLAGLVILRGFGPGYRIGRLLAVTPRASVAEAVAAANAGERRYLRVDGRIDSDDEFEDVHHRPLVLRRTTLGWRPAGSSQGWTTFESSTEAVAFTVDEGLDTIEVEGSALAEGLVVVPRESRGVLGDLGERAPAEVPADAEAKVVIEQVSSVEHATVLGMPRRTADGRVVIGPGLGRPLILSTLESDEAMRVLAGGAIGRSRVVLGLLAIGATLVVLAALWWLLESLVGGGGSVALAASPEPSLRPGSDTRTSGGGPGLVGEPLFAILGVLGIGLASILASLGYVRLTGGRAESSRIGSRGRRGGAPGPRA